MSPAQAPVDLAEPPVVAGGGEAGAAIRALDWSTTRLGAAQAWPQSLRTALGICLSARTPLALAWGPELIILHNDAFRALVGAPAMGRPAAELRPELRDVVAPLFLRVMKTGEPVQADEVMLPVPRTERMELICFTCACSAIHDESGRVAGVLCIARATTDQAIERRVREQLQRDNLYRHFMQAPFPVAVLQGADHAVELANPLILRAWGKTAEIVGQPIAHALPELRGQPFLDYLDAVFRTGVAHEGRAELVRLPTGPDGALEERYFDFVYAALREPSGAVEGVLVSAFDVTVQALARNDRLRALAEEQAARTRLQALFMQAPVPICMLEGKDHRYTLANPLFLSLVGQPELVGKTVAELFPHRVEQGVLGALDRVYLTGETYRGFEIAMRFARPAPEPAKVGLFNLVYEPFRDPAGHVVGIVAVVFEVTDVVLARQASEQARADAEAAAQAEREIVAFQERFVAILGHDLRNPLAAIDMGAALLRQQADKSGDATTARITARIRSSSLRMSRMVEQILDFSRSRVGGGLTIQRRAMDLCATLTTVIEELRTAHPARELVVRCTPLPGAWDRDRLEQVFSNLISNAVHHGSADTPVTVDARQVGQEIFVEVHNVGPPIPEAVRAKLFSPFRRGDRDSRAAKTAGLGLGLYISRELVVAHGGEISVRSSVEQGTTFRVTLPILASSRDEEVPAP